MLATFEAQVATLAQQAASGAQDVDLVLSQLLEGVPDDVRTEIIQRYRALVQELQEEHGVEPELTPQQQEELRLHKERERMILANWLSEKTLEKIRRAILSHPGLIAQITSIGEELQKRGVFFDTRKAQITSAELGGVTQQATINQDKQQMKDTGKER